MSLKNALFGATALTMAGTLGAFADGHAKELTIAIVNNGHMINMQKVAAAYTEETGVKLNWVSLEEGVLREQVTSDTATDVCRAVLWRKLDGDVPQGSDGRRRRKDHGQ